MTRIALLHALAHAVAPINAALAQSSMARAHKQVAEHTGLPVLTAVDSVVIEPRRRLGAT